MGVIEKRDKEIKGRRNKAEVNLARGQQGGWRVRETEYCHCEPIVQMLGHTEVCASHDHQQLEYGWLFKPLSQAVKWAGDIYNNVGGYGSEPERLGSNEAPCSHNHHVNTF